MIADRERVVVWSRSITTDSEFKVCEPLRDRWQSHHNVWDTRMADDSRCAPSPSIQSITGFSQSAQAHRNDGSIEEPPAAGVFSPASYTIPTSGLRIVQLARKAWSSILRAFTSARLPMRFVPVASVGDLPQLSMSRLSLLAEVLLDAFNSQYLHRYSSSAPVILTKVSHVLDAPQVDSMPGSEKGTTSPRAK